MSHHDSLDDAISKRPQHIVIKQLTIRGLEPQLERAVRRLAEREGLSLNQAVLRLLRKGAGLGASKGKEDVIGTSLDHLIGTWSAEEAREVMAAVADFELVDHALPDFRR